MDIIEAIKSRHSVRAYEDKKIAVDIVEELEKEIDLINKETGLNIQLMRDEPMAFSGLVAHYGKFSNANNYIALVGKKSLDLDEKLGYYGEMLVLRASQLGLNSCWVAGTFSKKKAPCKINEGEILRCVITIGYGVNSGVSHKSRKMEDCYIVNGDIPSWFLSGMEMVMLAPTAMNQQKFLFTLKEDKVYVKATGGFYSKIDLGIVKYHFEVSVGKDNFSWE